jgi:hypothetical protein
VKEFEQLLVAFSNGEADLESLRISVDTLVGESNGAATEALVILEAARAAGLPATAYTTLRRRLTALSRCAAD